MKAKAQGQGRSAGRRDAPGVRPLARAASTSARPTGPTWPTSSPTASRAGWTWSSCATRSSRPGRCWRGPPLAAAVCRDHGVPFVLNDRPDLALEVGADGVHVGQDDAPVALARRILGPDAIVGLSTHGPADLDGAADRGRHLHLRRARWRRRRPSPAVPGPGSTTSAQASARSSVPVFVTGGVTPEKIPAL